MLLLLVGSVRGCVHRQYKEEGFETIDILATSDGEQTFSSSGSRLLRKDWSLQTHAMSVGEQPVEAMPVRVGVCYTAGESQWSCEAGILDRLYVRRT